MTPANIIALPVAYTPSKATAQDEPDNLIDFDAEVEEFGMIVTASPGYEPPPIWAV